MFDRDKTLFSTEDRTLGDITTFEITDNGIGFTDANYRILPYLRHNLQGVQGREGRRSLHVAYRI